MFDIANAKLGIRQYLNNRFLSSEDSYNLLLTNSNTPYYYYPILICTSKSSFCSHFLYLLNPGGGEVCRTLPGRPWSPPSLLYNGYRVFPGEWR